MIVTRLRLSVVSVTEKEIRKIIGKHPWLPYEYAKRMAEDIKQKSSRTPDGLRTYNREYQRLRRAEKRGEATTDVPGIISGKYMLRKKKNAENAIKNE